MHTRHAPSTQNPRAVILRITLVVGFLCHSPWLWAQAPKQDQAAVQALRKAQGVLRELSQEKTALETEKAALLEQVKKLEATVKQLEPLQGEVERHKSSAEALKSANSSLEAQLNSGREREQQLRNKLKEIIAQAKQIQGDNVLLVEAVKEREQWIERCTTQNTGLLDTNRELLERYRDKGFWDKLADVEPFSGIGKVQTENTVQDYRFKLEDLQVTPFASPSASREAAAASQPAPDETAPEEADEGEQ